MGRCWNYLKVRWHGKRAIRRFLGARGIGKQKVAAAQPQRHHRCGATEIRHRALKQQGLLWLLGAVYSKQRNFLAGCALSATAELHTKVVLQ